MNIFPITQHWLSLDFINTAIPRNMLTYPSNFTIPYQKVSPQKHLEICLINKSHGNIIDSNKNEIVIINTENPLHIDLLQRNSKNITDIAKQPNTDSLVLSAVTVNNNHLKYPIDVKIITYPENNLKVLSSYSSISSQPQVIIYADRLYGQLMCQLFKLKQNSLEYSYFSNEIAKLKKHLLLLKKEKILTLNTKDNFYLWLKEFHNNQLNLGLTHEGMSFIPSIISEPYKIDINHNYYYYLLKNNIKSLENMITDVHQNSKMIEHFPELKDYKTYDIYKTQLFILTFLQKYNMLENYYKVREFLLIEDIHQYHV